MSVFIAPIVEGHGEVVSVPPLLHRVWNECCRAPERLEVFPPSRQSRGLIVHQSGTALGTAVQKSFLQLQQKLKRESGSRGLVLILIDAEGDCPAQLGPKLLATAKVAQANASIACVLANWMFENWLIAGSVTLGGVSGLPNPLPPVPTVEGVRGKSWIDQQLRSVSKNRAYSETIDCVEFVRRMDVQAARTADSFDKLCRELEKLIPPAVAPSPDPQGDTLT
jgi:hypothetical protein